MNHAAAGEDRHARMLMGGPHASGSGVGLRGQTRYRQQRQKEEKTVSGGHFLHHKPDHLRKAEVALGIGDLPYPVNSVRTEVQALRRVARNG